MAPTWLEYVENVLVNSGYAAKAAIYGTKDIQAWATSKSFSPSTEEMRHIVKGFIDPEYVIQKGITLQGKQFTCMNAGSDTMTGRYHKGGCVAVKCKKCVIVTVYDDLMHAGNCLALCHRLADYLKEQQF